MEEVEKSWRQKERRRDGRRKGEKDGEKEACGGRSERCERCEGTEVKSMHLKRQSP